VYVVGAITGDEFDTSSGDWARQLKPMLGRRLDWSGLERPAELDEMARDTTRLDYVEEKVSGQLGELRTYLRRDTGEMWVDRFFRWVAPVAICGGFVVLRQLFSLEGIVVTALALIPAVAQWGSGDARSRREHYAAHLADDVLGERFGMSDGFAGEHADLAADLIRVMEEKRTHSLRFGAGVLRYPSSAWLYHRLRVCKLLV
jgi:hypothetical protein